MALTTTALADLQTQQQELNSHRDKIRALEDALAEHKNIKEEVRALREMMKQRELDLHDHSARHELRGGFDDEEEENVSGEHEDDMDDTSSIATMVPHELERVEEEDEEQLAADAQGITPTPGEVESRHNEEMQQEQQRRGEAEEARIEQIEDEEARRRRNDELGRPRTPEPTNLGMRDGDRDPFASLHRPSILERSSMLITSPRHTSPSSPLSKVAATGSAAGDTSEEVFEQVLNQVSALMALTSSLEAQHIAAQSTIAALENKVQALEATVKATETTQLSKEVQTSPASSSQPSLSAIADDAQERETLTTMVMEWKKSIEGQWSNVREDWDKERERLSRAREQWELQSKSMDTGLEKLATLQSAATAAFQEQQQQRERERELEKERQRRHCAELVNGDAMKHIGLATPPSPRSLSSDSNRPRRRRSGGSRRGRSHHRSHSGSCERDAEFDTDTDITLASEDPSPSHGKIALPAPRSFSPPRHNITEEQDEDEEEDTVLGTRSKSGAATLATPESSVYKLPSIENLPEADATWRQPTPYRGGDRVRRIRLVKITVSNFSQQAVQIQTTIGVLVLAVAAAAVIWRVKPET